jgi:oligo-1,6-glucosidase
MHGKWATSPPKLTALKAVLSKWQTALFGKAWNSLYWDNHDQPRVVSRFGNDKEYRFESAKMLAVCLHFMQGTPYVYQGDELAIPNANFTDISQYRDVESINAYNDLVGRGIYTNEEMLERLRYASRDNARQPMPWDEAEKQANDPDSVFSFYKKLISLRKTLPILIYGDYELLLPDSEELFVYKRKFDGEEILVLCNFTDKHQAYINDDFAGAEIVISNYSCDAYAGSLRPYEALALRIQGA